MTLWSSTSNKGPKYINNLSEAYMLVRIYKKNSAYTKDPNVYSLGMSTAITMTIPVHSHKLKRQTLEPCFSKRRINMMADGLYEELEQVFDKIREYGDRGEDVPIQELYYCYTVSHTIKVSHIQELMRCRAI